jgi:hypothetical protein
VAGVRQIIDGPDFTALPNSLWDAAQHPVPGGPHWQQGITWIDQCGGAATVMDECIAVTGTGGAPTAQSSMASTASQQNRGATAFTVYAEFDCAPVGQDITQNKAETALMRAEAYQVSKAFWTGTGGSTANSTATQTVWPHLAANATLDDAQGIRLQTAATQLVTGGDDPAVSLGQLEYNLAQCYGGQGVIHIPLFALPTFAARGLVRMGDDGRLYTLAGNLVVAGSGYSGSSSAGVAPSAGTAWIYATGAVFGFRSDVFSRPFPGTFDRSENTVRFLASRTYLFGFECCHLAALVTLGVPT